MTKTGFQKRKSARLVILDPTGRLLLFRYQDKHQPAFWSTPGGELIGTENYRSAAERELMEETGFDSKIGPLVYKRDDQYAVARSVPAHWFERYYLVSCDHANSPSKNGWSDEERSTIERWKWWTIDEMFENDAVFLPSFLPALLDSVLVQYRGANAVRSNNLLPLAALVQE